MLDPLTFSLKMQHAAASTVCSAAGMMAANWVRLLKGEQGVVGMPEHRRSDELHAHEDHIAKGARWTDHYGKRTHDIDVEHMR
jgi:hypothetical protein